MIFYTMLDVKGKSKNNVNVRLNLEEYYRWRELELKEARCGKVLKPKAH